ncbi:YncE family protein [Streptomyces sp. NPDC047130]|uniref:YncE family protein n=1 Tax=Streptomyces sp. NPDC047130 TaxID=3155261 RepID=UPI0034077E71
MSSTRHLRLTVAVAVAAAAGLTLTSPASAHPHKPKPKPATVESTTPVWKGLYQTAYSERNDVLWATASTGRPPVTQTALLKLDPDTLEVLGSFTPPLVNETTGAREAVYGIDVDDENNTVWVTNTRDNGVAVYSQRTGEHLAFLPNVGHAREVVVDEKRDLAWATSYNTGEIVAFDTDTFAEKKRIAVEGAGLMGVALDERTGKVYATDLNNPRIVQFSPYKDEAVAFHPAGAGAISVSLSRNGRTAYTTNQTDGTVSVVNLSTSTLKTTIPTGAGALSVATDERTGRLVVANRVAATVSVVDPRTGAVQDLVTQKNPNHVTIVDDTAYVLDKSGAGAEGLDLGYRIDLGH